MATALGLCLAGQKGCRGDREGWSPGELSKCSSLILLTQKKKKAKRYQKVYQKDTYNE